MSWSSIDVSSMSPFDPATQVAKAVADRRIGFKGRRHVSKVRFRHDDFPEPVVTSDAGRCLLWKRQDIEAWAKRRNR
jgi:hypothetical protein